MAHMNMLTARLCPGWRDRLADLEVGTFGHLTSFLQGIRECVMERFL